MISSMSICNGVNIRARVRVKSEGLQDSQFQEALRVPVENGFFFRL